MEQTPGCFGLPVRSSRLALNTAGGEIRLLTNTPKYFRIDLAKFDQRWATTRYLCRLGLRKHLSELPTYQELRRGWVNTAALLGSGSLIRYESVLEALRPFGGEVARVSAWSRGERSRPACGRSVSGGQPNDDEN